MLIRQETQNDYPKIKEVNDRAFGQKNEGKLVENLRKTEAFIAQLSLVAEIDDVVGHILFYPITIRSGIQKHRTLSLAPMAVLPEYQNQKIGSSLIREGIRKAKELGYASIIVIGHANYYRRFGFKPASYWKIKPPFEVPQEAFMALELTTGALKGKEGVVEFPREYYNAL